MEDRPWSSRVVLVDLEQDRLLAVRIGALAEERERPTGVTEEPPPVFVHRLSPKVAAFHSEWPCAAESIPRAPRAARAARQLSQSR
jgi:hypothetical protein